MKKISNKMFDEERALYGVENIELESCRFDGRTDGESAIKEATGVSANNCFFNLRYPFWHNDGLKIKNSYMTGLCRAAIWYSNNIDVENTKIHGIKALRECENISLKSCDIISPEFGWSVKNIELNNCTAESEYFMLRSENLNIKNLKFKGKYSFQYIKNAVFENCEFDTKDAFWHAENVIVKNSIIKGEYLSWYSNSLTLINCTIVGTQPLCYCKNLKLIDCKMIDADLCFEKSNVEASIKSDVISIKNPRSGKITAPSVGEIIRDDNKSHGEIKILN